MKKNIDIAKEYDSIYEKLSATTLLQDILKKAFDADYIQEINQFSFLKRKDLNQIHDVLSIIPSPLLGLELGCGTGELTSELARIHNGKWFGLDISSTAIKLANQRIQKTYTSFSVNFAIGHFESIPLPLSSIDCIIAIDSIQHSAPYIVSAFEINRVLKPGGYLIFSNWIKRAPTSQLILEDPLYVELIKNNFIILTTIDTDPNLAKQIEVYSEIYRRKLDVERILGRHFLENLIREGHHILISRNSIQRALTIARKQ